MHPFGLFLAATDVERTHGARRPTFAAQDATPLPEPEPSRRQRFTAMLRRRVASTTTTATTA